MRCPICKSDVPESQRERKGSAYPFCSERCKLIDLGRWLSGKYQIPVSPAQDEHHPQPRQTPAEDDMP